MSVESRSGTISVHRTYKDGGVISREEGSEEVIDTPVFSETTATIGHNARMTISLPNYESVQVGVHCTLPCYINEMEEAYKAAKSFVDRKLNEEVTQLREYRKSLK
jgi:hypothetical protein